MPVIILALTAIAMSACAHPRVIDGVEYRPYGLFNSAQHKNPKISYEVSVGSIIVALLLSETCIVPVYTVGWDLFQPVAKKTDEVH